MLCICFWVPTEQKNKKEHIVVLLFIFILLFKQICGSLYNVSIYHQLINFLSSKNNIVVIYLLYLYILETRVKKNKNSVIKFLIYFILIFFPVTDCNKMFYFFIYFTIEPNINLINGILLIHPIILYNSYIYTFIKNKDYFFKLNNQTFLKTFMYIHTSIVLGMWWAEQELSWGGWWSWDFVELLALCIVYLTLYTIHKKKFLYNRVILLTSILIITTAVRFNLVNSIHNFVSTSTENQNNWYIYTTIFVLFVVFAFFIRIQLKPHLQKGWVLFLTITLLFYIYQLFGVCDLNTNTNAFYYNVNTPSYKTLLLVFILVLLCYIFIYNKYDFDVIKTLIIIVPAIFLKNWFFIFFILYFVNNNKKTILFRKFTMIHNFICIMLIFCIYTMYIFINFFFKTTNQSNFYILVNEYFLSKKNLFFFDNNYQLYSYDQVFLQNKIILDFFSNFFWKKIFEKNLLFSYVCQNEFYSYDLQILTQINSHVLWYLFLVSVFFFLWKIFLKKKKKLVF